jgi:anti-sigma regulatory factor (Ser/Thr protein kinase)
MHNKRFEFLKSSYHLSSDIQEILGFINDELPPTAPISELLFKAKIITTELLTNSLKHAGVNSTIIDVKISEHDLRILKVDFGTPLSLIQKHYPINTKIPISNDILHTLYAILDSGKNIHFFCDEINMEDILAVENIVEHFGLLIITKAADKFTYHYNEQTKENLFEITIKF